MSMTDKQQLAIDARGSDILVSAAAGSGKTTVLAHRIVSLLREGHDITRMLVCTFTNASARDMKKRIYDVIEQEAERLRDPELMRQAELCQIADICTMHAFAIKLCRENALELGIGADVRIAGDDETSVMRRRAMEKTLRTLYERDDADLLALRDTFFSDSDRPMVNSLFEIYSFAMSMSDGLDWITAKKNRPMEQLLKSYVLSRLRRLRGLLEYAANIAGEGGGAEQEQTCLRDAESVTRAIAVAANASLDEAWPYISGLAVSRQSRAQYSTKEHEKALIDLCRKVLADIQKRELTSISNKLKEEERYVSDTELRCYNILKEFDSIYSAMKRKKGVIDFDDVFLMGSRILDDEEKRRTISARYDYVFIDEYQDTNPVQESFLSRVSNNMFMVGDIKQSIYRFRNADPMIFRNRADEYSAGGDGMVIHMNKNFRSSPAVIDLVNTVMGRLMVKDVAEIDYTDDHALRAGTDRKGGAELMISTGENDAACLNNELSNVASRIVSLYRDGTPYKDIAVLVRTKTHIAEILAEFARWGIPAECADGVSVSMDEVDTFVNLLKVCDSVSNDVPLISVMRSHVGGFDEADLARVRADHKDGDFCSAFIAAAREGDEKCARLLEKLRRFRMMERGMTLREFISAVARETEWEAYTEILPDGARRGETWRAFYDGLMEKAAEEESLFTLLRTLDDIMKKEGAYAKIAAGGSTECVHVMTIHKSKGLEFPVVIIMNASAGTGGNDRNSTILIDRELGLGMDMQLVATRTRRRTFTKMLVAEHKKKLEGAEEIRVLYVAMTRAMERLIISGGFTKPEEHLLKLIRPNNPYEIASLGNILDMALWGCMKSPYIRLTEGGEVIDCKNAVARLLREGAERTLAAPSAALAASEVLEASKNAAPIRFLSARGIDTPAKVGVSTLLPEYVPDEADGEALGTPLGGGASSGTALHIFMAHFSMKRSTRSEILAEMAEMEKRGILTKKEAALAHRYAGNAAAFSSGSMAYRIRAAKRVMREVPFTYAATASELGMDGGDAPVLVQGIIDLLFQEADGSYVIIDYKTNKLNDGNLTNLTAHYQLQLTLYEQAVTAILKAPVKESLLYFVRADKYVSL